MSVILFVFFSDGGYKEFTITNPPAVPLVGDEISFNWRDFITEEKEVEKFEELERNDCFIVAKIWKKIYPHKVEVNIVLEEESGYSKLKNAGPCTH